MLTQHTKSTVQVIECPRDAMQGWSNIISTKDKVRYLSALLKVGYHTIDFGSFVSAKAVPQMEDTADVLRQIKASNILQDTQTKLLAIVANLRGAEEAAMFEEISFLGYPFSISPTFQYRNVNSTIYQSFERLEEIREICHKNDKKLVVYISMGFGNPYADEYSEKILMDWIKKIIALNIETISIADTVGVATEEQVSTVMTKLFEEYPSTDWGVHLHAKPDTWINKVASAYNAGCRRFDATISGIGGCPFAKDELVGNIDTIQMVEWFAQHQVKTGLNIKELLRCKQIASEIFV